MKLETPLEPQSSGFFTLPRELRDEIYALIFTSDPFFVYHCRGLAINLHYGPLCCSSASRRPTQSWLFTSKTVMTEALEECAKGGMAFWLELSE